MNDLPSAADQRATVSLEAMWTDSRGQRWALVYLNGKPFLAAEEDA